MKFRNFMVIALAIMCSLTVIMEAIPLTSALSDRSGYASDPRNSGSYLLYEFTDGAIYNYINGTPTLLSQTGALKITVENADAVISISIVSPKFNGTPIGFKYTQNYSEKYSLPISSDFVNNFVNQISLTRGTMNVLDDETGVSAAPLSNDYYVTYAGSDKTLSGYAKGIGYTSPSVLYFPDFKENGSSLNYPYGNFYQYDRADGWNLLVSAQLLSGTTGISAFLQQLLNDTNVNLPIMEVTDFNMVLVGTNIALQPMDMLHYLTEYIFFVIVIWFLGGAYIALTYRMAKSRSK